MLRDYEKWDGIERRNIDRRTISRDEGGYYINDYPQQHHYEQPQQSQLSKWVSPSVLIAMLYPLVGGIGSYTWDANNRITKIEYNIQSVVDRHNQHEKEDIEFKNELKDLNIKIDHLKEQLSSTEQTIMQLVSETTRNQRRSP